MKKRHVSGWVSAGWHGLVFTAIVLFFSPAMADNNGYTCLMLFSQDLPAVYTVTGGGNYCAGSPGLSVGLNGSETGVIYTLVKNNVPTPITHQGDGQPFIFGLQHAGVYTVSATNSFGTIIMNGEAIITEQPLPQVKIKASENRICSGTEVTFYAVIDQASNPVYQWYKNYTPVGGNETTYTYVPNNGDLIQVIVSSGDCTGFSDVFETIVFPVTAGITVSCENTQVIAGEPVTFIAETFNAGNNYQIDWYLNDQPLNEHGIEFTYQPENSDEIYATLAVGDDVPCLKEYFFESNTILMSVCSSYPQVFTLNSEGGYLCEFDYGILTLSGSEPGVLYSVYSENEQGNYVWYPFTDEKPGTGGPLEFDVSAGVFKIQAQNACFTLWMDGVCTFEYYNTTTPIVVSNNDIMAGTSVTFSVPAWREDSPAAIYIWNRSNQESYIGETYTCIPENGDYINAGMRTPCQNYDSDGSTIVMFVRDHNAHYTNWTGNFSNNWNNALNWDNGLPDITSIVTIPEIANHFPTLTTPAICASLIMSNSASFIGAEYLDVKSVKITKENTANQFHFISSPLANKTTWGNVFPYNQNAIWVREYWEGTGNWENHSIRNLVSNDKGYSYKGLQSGHATFIGWLTHGDPVSWLFYNNTSNDIDRDGWNLMANPYSSSLDWDLISGNATEAAVYAWNGYNYISWNGSVGALNQGIIPPLSGFFVKALNRGTGHFQITKTARVHANEIPYKKADPYAVLEIEVTDGTYDDRTYFRLNDLATHSFDHKFDAHKLFGIGEAPQLYSATDGLPLSINEFPWQKTTIEQHLCFSSGIPGSYTLHFSLKGIDPYLSATFTDRQKKVSFDLRMLSQYNFDYLPGEDPKRFFVKFSPTVEKVNTPDLQAYAHNGILHLLNKNQITGELHVVSTNAVTVFTSNFGGTDHQLFNLNLPTGIYIVQLVSENEIRNVKVVL